MGHSSASEEALSTRGTKSLICCQRPSACLTCERTLKAYTHRAVPPTVLMATRMRNVIFTISEVHPSPGLLFASLPSDRRQRPSRVLLEDSGSSFAHSRPCCWAGLSRCHGRCVGLKSGIPPRAVQAAVCLHFLSMSGCAASFPFLGYHGASLNFPFQNHCQVRGQYRFLLDYM